MRKLITGLCLLFLVGCGGSSAPTTPDVPITPPPPEDNTPPQYNLPSGELVEWATSVDAAAFEGSGTHCDLDNDGKLEAIMPIAVVDSPEASFLVVLEGDSGVVRWQSALGNAGYGYPLCVDVNGDGVLDILTAGRIRDIVALSGVDGQQIWSFVDNHPDVIEGNTYSAVAETKDVSTFFFSSGGGGGNLRLTGELFAVDLSGHIIARWKEPNNREIYTTPAIYRSPDDSLYLAVGSGGETLPGEMFVLKYDEAEKVFTQVSSVPSACNEAGWIASPVFADVTGDGTPQVIVSDYCGTTMAFTLEGQVLWQTEADLLYSTGNPAVADLNGDGILDVISVFGSLNWSINETYSTESSQAIAINGMNGTVMWKRQFNSLISASSVIADYDSNNVPDIFLIGFAGLFGSDNTSRLLILDGEEGTTLLNHAISATSGTPALGDLNGNGTLDILFNETSATTTTSGGVILLEFAGALPPASNSINSFRGMPAHNGHYP